MNFRYDYGAKEGIRSSSVSLSNELRDEIDAMYGKGQRSAFLERAGWLLLALLKNNKKAIDEWGDWADRNMNHREADSFWLAVEYLLLVPNEGQSY